MSRLVASDYRAILDFVRLANDVEVRGAMPSDVVAALGGTIGATIACYHEWTPSSHSVTIAAEDPQLVERVSAQYARFRHDDPFPGGPGPGADPERTPFGRGLKFSDTLTTAEFRRRGFYAEICRPLGVDYVMKIFLPTTRDHGSAFVFDRARSDFTERDRTVLETLAPHLVQLRLRTRSGPTRTASALTAREREILDLVARGKTNAEIGSALSIATGTVRKHLDNVYGKLGVRNRAEAVACLLGEERPAP